MTFRHNGGPVRTFTCCSSRLMRPRPPALESPRHSWLKAQSSHSHSFHARLCSRSRSFCTAGPQRSIYRTRSARYRYRTMASAQSPHSPKKWRIWQPANGLVFSPAARPAQPDRLDMVRAFHGSLPDLTDTIPPTVEGEDAPASQSSRRGSAPPSLDPSQEQRPDDAGIASEVIDQVVAGKEADAAAETKEEEDIEEDDTPTGPHESTLPFKMTDDTFRVAQLAEPGKPESHWTYTLYRGPDKDGKEDSARVTVHYCRSKATTEKVCQYFLDEKVIGFDLEWMPNALRFQGPRRNVCLVQLASPSRIALFHLALYPKTDSLVAPTLKKIMEDNAITKVGVWIRGDCTRLKTFLGINAEGIFELSHLYRLVKFSGPGGDRSLINKRLVPLATMVQEHLHLPMFKGKDVRESDWSQPLRLDQLIYSASDAYAGVQLYDVMNIKREALDPTPPLPHHAELNLPIRLAESPESSAEESVAEDEGEEEPNVEDADQAENGDKDEFTPSSSELAAMQDLVIEAEPSGDAAQETTTTSTVPPSTTSKPARKSATPKAAPKPKHPRILAAETWAATYRTAHPPNPARPRSSAGQAALRAYYIWHTHMDTGPVALAALLRDPPLQTTTVVSYILEAIKLEKLPYAKERLGKEVLALLPQEMTARRYGKLWQACSGFVGKDGSKSKDAEKDGVDGTTAKNHGD